MTTTAANEQLDDIKTALDETEATIDDEGDKVLLVRWVGDLKFAYRILDGHVFVR